MATLTISIDHPFVGLAAMWILVAGLAIVFLEAESVSLLESCGRFIVMAGVARHRLMGALKWKSAAVMPGCGEACRTEAIDAVT
jgi:hypothetical protein